MITHEKPFRIISNRSIWQLATLRQEYLKLGYKVILDSLKGSLEVYSKSQKEETSEYLFREV